MNRKDLTDSFRGVSREIGLLLDKAGKKPKSGQIHRLRVLCKKLNAFFPIAEYEKYGRILGLKELTELRRLYSAAGRLRNIQIILKILDHYQASMNISLLAFRGELLEREVSARKALGRRCSAFKKSYISGLNKKFRQLLLPYSDDEIHSLLLALLQQKNEAMRQPFLMLPDDGNLHRLRSLLKNALYTAEFLQPWFPEMNEPAGEYRKHAVQLAQKLGEWHDIQVFTIRLKNFRNKRSTGGIRLGNYDAVIRRARADARKIKSEIIKCCDPKPGR